MSEFSPEWLRLRESADHRARNPHLLSKLREYFDGRESIAVADLGTGTGSNLRATAPFLPRVQHWTLIDNDPRLLAAACDEIAAWADSSRATANGIEVSKGGRSILIELKRVDLAADPAVWRDGSPDLVTAAALFDLVSGEWIERFTASVTASRAAFYTALTHSHAAKWSPPHPADATMTAAFERHFAGDKGFGRSAGSAATHLLAENFSRAGYKVERRESLWRLGAGDERLIATLAVGWAEAAAETGLIAPGTIAGWLNARKVAGTGCAVGHEDLLALPG